MVAKLRLKAKRKPKICASTSAFLETTINLY